MVEQRIRNAKVVGSTPISGTSHSSLELSNSRRQGGEEEVGGEDDALAWLTERAAAASSERGPRGASMTVTREMLDRWDADARARADDEVDDATLALPPGVPAFASDPPAPRAAAPRPRERAAAAEDPADDDDDDGDDDETDDDADGGSDAPDEAGSQAASARLARVFASDT